MLVFDSHAHIIPPLGGKCGYSSIGEHLDICQRAMHEHLIQSSRCKRDNTVVEKKLWHPTDDSLRGKLEVGFRVGRFGRFEWTQDGEDCYLQYLPPYAENMGYSPDQLLAMMDYSGVHKAVLQCGGVYGNLNDYYATVMAEHPHLAGKLYPLARVKEEEAYTETEILRLERCIQEYSLRGLWFAAQETHFTSQYWVFWEKVRELDIPVFLLFFPDELWANHLMSLTDWVKEFPEMPCVLAQAFPLSARRYDDAITVPGFVDEIINSGTFYIEIVYPIGRGAIEDYPFLISRKAVQALYERFGAERLVWGSDIPMVERYCTYRQSLKYITAYCDFVLPDDLELILGKNLEKIFTDR